MFPPSPPSATPPPTAPPESPSPSTSTSTSTSAPADPTVGEWHEILGKVVELAHKADGVTHLTQVINELRAMVEQHI
jgi:hypothetical protein